MNVFYEFGVLMACHYEQCMMGNDMSNFVVVNLMTWQLYLEFTYH